MINERVQGCIADTLTKKVLVLRQFRWYYAERGKICTYRKSGITRKTTAAYPELRYLGKKILVYLLTRLLVNLKKIPYLPKIRNYHPIHD